jgi:hypothetical protein
MAAIELDDATYAYVADSAANKTLTIALASGAVTDLVTSRRFRRRSSSMPPTSTGRTTARVP